MNLHQLRRYLKIMLNSKLTIIKIIKYQPANLIVAEVKFS